MKFSQADLRTLHFYDWEQRGRGWRLFSEPIELEPEFVPFFPYEPVKEELDDGSRFSLIGSVTSLVIKAFTKKSEGIEEDSLYAPVNAYTFKNDEPLRGFSISFPEDEKLKAREIEQFLIMLTSCQVQVSFEIIAEYTSIRIQFVCRASDSSYVESQLKAYFPKCITQDLGSAIATIVDEHKNVCIYDFGLEEEFTRPISLPKTFDIDPLTGIFGILENLERNDRIVIQILFKAAANPWAASVNSAVRDGEGSSFFVDAPEMPDLASEKTASPLFATVIRLMGQSTEISRTHQITEQVANTLINSSKSSYNSLLPLSIPQETLETYAVDFVLRQSHKLGMLLSTQELSTFVHYPLSIHSVKLKRNIQKTKPAPQIAVGHDFILGKNIHQGEERIPTLNTPQRLKHMHVIGATGTGKSTFLQSCIAQDMFLGNGVAVLDPHGDLIENILPHIPENRLEDVIIIDPSDAEYPVGFNILTAHSEIEKEILASDLVAVFRRLSTSFGDQMHSVLANAILAFLESNTGGTIFDLRRFLIEKEFREDFLKTVSDQNVRYYWDKEFPLLKTSSIGPILTRLDSFLRPKLIRNMVAQKKSLDFENILDTQKIVLIKLSQGLIGIENSYLLGTFLVSKIYQAAMARQAQEKEIRKNFFLYIDEFQNFITPSMAAILSSTRKYGLGCILAHQDMIQLQKQDTELASAVISNAGTRVCFRLGEIDAKRFEEGFSSFESKDFQNLGIGQAITRIERPDFDFNMETLELREPLTPQVKENAIAFSRKQYGTPREEIVVDLNYSKDLSEIPEQVQTKQEVKSVVVQTTVDSQTEEHKTSQVLQVSEVDDSEKSKTVGNLVRQKELKQHRYLQTLIKKMAEARDYIAKIEEPTPDGKGRVDVSLEKMGKKIACEIGVSTSTEWEVHNIEKCISAGYDIVIAVPVDTRMGEVLLNQIKNTITKNLLPKVFVMEANELFQYLDKEAIQEEHNERKMKGYRVKVEYGAMTNEKVQQKRDALAKVILEAATKQNLKD